MSAFRVLQILLSNLIWYQNKSWSIHGGEEHVKRWHLFDFVLTINMDFCLSLSIRDTVNLELNT